MRAVFHRLRVESIRPLTADAAVVCLAVPEPLRAAYQYTAGQHVTVRFDDPVTGSELRRSYSLCAPPPPPTGSAAGPARLEIAVKRHGPGGFGDHALRKLAVADQLDVLTPLGGFRAYPDTRRHIAIAAGSGITPVLAILAEVLRDRADTTAALLYGNRTVADVMFLDELADLKDRYGSRFTMLHVLSGEDRGIPLLTGRMDRDRLATLLDAVDANADSAYYLCGPAGLVEDARALLGARGAAKTRFELFDGGGPTTGTPTRGQGSAAVSQAAHSARITVTLGGRSTRTDFLSGDPNLLTAVLRDRPEVPFACTGGVCGTCRARLTSGSAQMARDYALEPEEKAAGFVLTCQALPTSAELSLDFDA
jgi:ring-1,2-phenylacetyl-CoA epoxidase subunit PaaE